MDMTRYAPRAIRKAWPAALAILAVATTSAAAEPVADFYRGKTLTLIAGFPPGGGYDANLRVLARHFGRFVPGEPQVVATNMPGAGSLTAANHIYGKLAPDGATLGMFASSVAMAPLLGNKAALFDPVNFSWIGSMSQEVAYCGVWQTPGAATSFDEMLTKETIIGAGSPQAITFQHPNILKHILGTKIRVIGGYAGTRDINLAMQRGEVNGTCGMFSATIKAQFRDDVASGRLKLVIQMGSKTSTEFGAVPSAFDYAKNDAERAVLDVHFRQLLLTRPLAGPPGIPADRLQALRHALAATLTDKDFLSEAQRAGLDIDPVSGEEAVALLKRLASFPPEVMHKAQEAMGR
jgi:tripartite-type tricarboxylate transporter receptor subunit TctC